MFDGILSAHNKHRSDHGVPALLWDDNLAASAANWAANCVFGHEFNNEYGENIFATTGDDLAKALVQAAESW